MYAQLADQFRFMIESGKLHPGDRFPAELDLAKKYGIGRITVRSAINELVQEGLLIRIQGKGTFVAEPKIERELVNVASFTDRIQSRGMRAGSRLLDVSVIPASRKIAQVLGVSENDPVVEFKRLRLSNDEPVALETSYLSVDRFPGIEDENLENKSLYQILESKYQVRLVHSSKTLELVRASKTESNMMQIPAGTPLFLMTAVVYAEDNQVIEYAKILFHGDRFKFQVY